ncbi:hypothetical protein DIPPA_01579 [Diplonema papillatum]|nr:hypothetical protein DIPPA_01579 [Diplonema papillatum]
MPKEAVGTRVRAAREKLNLSPEDAAERASVVLDVYELIESGSSELEHWAPLLSKIALATSRPTSRLLSPTGKPKDVVAGNCGPRIKAVREEVGLSASKLVDSLPITGEQYNAIEAGESGLEEWCPRLLQIAAAFGQPVFNFTIEIEPAPLP